MPRWFRTFLHLTPVVAGTSLAAVLGLLAFRELVPLDELRGSSDAVGNYLQTVGGIAADTNTIGPYIYSVSVAGGNLGVGGAIAVILVVVMLALSAYYIRSTLRQDEA